MSNSNVRKDGINKGLIASLIGAVVLLGMLSAICPKANAETSVETPPISSQASINAAVDSNVYTPNYLPLSVIAFLAMTLAIILAMLTDIFGDHPEIRILDVLGECRRYDLTVNQIASFTKVSRATAEEKLRELVKRGLIIQTRKVGRNKLYMLAQNESTELIEKLAVTYNLMRYKMSQTTPLPPEIKVIDISAIQSAVEKETPKDVK